MNRLAPVILITKNRPHYPPTTLETARIFLDIEHFTPEQVEAQPSLCCFAAPMRWVLRHDPLFRV